MNIVKKTIGGVLLISPFIAIFVYFGGISGQYKEVLMSFGISIIITSAIYLGVYLMVD